MKDGDSERVLASNAAEVEVQLVDALYKGGLPTISAGAVFALIVYFGLQASLGREGLLVWLAAFSAVTVFRFILFPMWRRGERTQSRARLLEHLYGVGAFISGLLWAGLVMFYDHSMPFYAQLLMLVTLSGLPVVAVPTNSMLLRVYFAFSLPICLALLYWSVFQVAVLNTEFAIASVAYAFVLVNASRVFHENFRATLSTAITNRELVDKLSQANARLEKIAYLDPLTGLANRRWFQEQAEAAMERSRRHGAILALLLVDLDGFKKINDTLGHEAGDQLLVTVVNKLKSTLRSSDIVIRKTSEVARFGGDEFIILLEDIETTHGAEWVAKRVVELLAEPIELVGQQVKASASIGVALYPDHGPDIPSLIRLADLAMYQAKKQGGDRYCLAQGLTSANGTYY